jgi:hypothetical protein
MALFVLSNLHHRLRTRPVSTQQVYQIFIIHFNKRSLDVIVPRGAALLLELPAPRKQVRNRSRDDAHRVVRVERVSIEVDACHGERLAGARLAVGEDRAVEAVDKVCDQRERGRGEERVLRRRRPVHLVKGKNLLLGGREGRGRGGGGGMVGGRCGGCGAGRRGRACIDGYTGGGDGGDDGALEAGGDGGRVLVCGRADAESCGRVLALGCSKGSVDDVEHAHRLGQTSSRRLGTATAPW